MKIGVGLPLEHMIGLHGHLEEYIRMGEADAKIVCGELITRRLRAALVDSRSRVDFEKVVDSLDKLMLGEDGEHGKIYICVYMQNMLRQC